MRGAPDERRSCGRWKFSRGSRLVVLRLFAVCSVVRSCAHDVTRVTADIHCCLQARNQLCFFFVHAWRLSACLWLDPSWEYNKIPAFKCSENT